MAEDSSEKSKSENRSVVSQKVLFVRNLPFSTTDQDLENLFSEVGPIKRCFVIRDKGRSLSAFTIRARVVSDFHRFERFLPFICTYGAVEVVQKYRRDISRQ